MKISEIEWPLLRNALAGFGVAFLIAAVAAGVTESRLRARGSENQVQQEQLNAARERYYNALQDRQMVDAYWPEYRKLEAMGFVGDENRLRWVDVMRDVARKNRVLGLFYDVQPRASGVLPGGIDAGEFQVNTSEMTMRMNLLHEGNLLGLLADLGTRNAGLYSLRSCLIERMADTIQMQGNVANLTANCTLAWHTIQPGGPPS